MIPTEILSVDPEHIKDLETLIHMYMSRFLLFYWRVSMMYHKKCSTAAFIKQYKKMIDEPPFALSDTRINELNNDIAIDTEKHNICVSSLIEELDNLKKTCENLLYCLSKYYGFDINSNYLIENSKVLFNQHGFTIQDYDYTDKSGKINEKYFNI